MIAYRPDLPERPFSCNLNNAEVFSCVLGHEADSALSIIDPVTINVEISGRRPNSSGAAGGSRSEHYLNFFSVSLLTQ